MDHLRLPMAMHCLSVQPLIKVLSIFCLTVKWFPSSYSAVALDTFITFSGGGVFAIEFITTNDFMYLCDWMNEYPING